MSYFRGRRRKAVAGVVALAALVSATMFVVLPAVAAGNQGDPIQPPSYPGNILPSVSNVGGSNFSCTASAGRTGLSQFPQISNPVNGTYTDVTTGASVTITNPTGADRNKYFSFVFTGGKVYDVGVKGGTDTAWYKYDPVIPGGVSSDGGVNPANNAIGYLHATRNNTGSLVVASITTFCYKVRRAKVGGKIFFDLNNDGDAATNPPLGGWTVTAYRVSDGTQVATTTSSADGTYSFPSPLLVGNYKVCETAPAGSSGYTPAPIWKQTVPMSGATCPNPLSIGRNVALTAESPGGDVTDVNFGNIAVVQSTCGQSIALDTGGGDTYQVQVQGSAGDAKCSGQYVLATFGSSTIQLAKFAPYCKPLTPSAPTNCPTNNKIAVVEKIVWTGADPQFGPQQNTVNMWYDDGNLQGTVDRTTNFAKLCSVDARVSAFVLPANYDAQSAMPTGTQIDGVTPHTSCILTATYSAPPSGTGHVYTAFVLSSTDPVRGDG